MSARQIDEALRLWGIRLNAAAQNLIDLQSDPVYTRISAADSHLSGETAQRSAVAVRTLGTLLQYFDLLQRAIARAEELRRDMPAIFGAEEREREILAVLQGKSIHLPPIQVPLGQRSLLTSVENVEVISPSDLLIFMESAFESVKKIVLQLNAAWESLGSSLNQASELLAHVGSGSGTLSVADRLDLTSAAESLHALERSAKEDPLGSASQGLARANETLRRLAGKLEDSKRQREQARLAFGAARDLLMSIKAEHQATRAAYLEARDKTGYELDFQSTDEKVSGLIAWFDRLDGAIGVAAPAALLVGLANWTKAAHSAIDCDRAVLARAKQQLATRSELRGRLDALKAKARAYSLAEDDELAALADQATALLYRRPTPIRDASSLVSAYEARLNSQARKIV